MLEWIWFSCFNVNITFSCANSVDPDLKAPEGALRSEPALFVIYSTEYIILTQYTRLKRVYAETIMSDANSLEPDQTPGYSGSDQAPNCLPLKLQKNGSKG